MAWAYRRAHGDTNEYGLPGKPLIDLLTKHVVNNEPEVVQLTHVASQIESEGHTMVK